MKRAGITAVTLEAKEGLSLLNGTQGMLALLSLALREADILVDTADVAASLSLDALRGSPGAFDARIMHARAYAGAATTARNLAHLNEGSQIRESHRASVKDPRVQDAYSLRCTPQVHGAVRDSLAQAREMAAVELNSATDNPLVFARDAKNGDIVSGGNFHGQPLAMAADQVAIAIATLGGIAERRIEQMTNPLTSMLPAFLTPDPGVNSGLMVAQITAAALDRKSTRLNSSHRTKSYAGFCLKKRISFEALLRGAFHLIILRVLNALFHQMVRQHLLISGHHGRRLILWRAWDFLPALVLRHFF